VSAGSTPSDSTSPKQSLVAYFTGKPGSWLDVRTVRAWSRARGRLEAKVLPASVDFLADGQGAPVFRRGVEEATNGTMIANYELRVVRVGANLYPEARFVYKSAGKGVPVAVPAASRCLFRPPTATSMTHLAATYDGNGKRLTLYVNGVSSGSTQNLNNSAPATRRRSGQRHPHRRALPRFRGRTAALVVRAGFVRHHRDDVRSAGRAGDRVGVLLQLRRRRLAHPDQQRLEHGADDQSALLREVHGGPGRPRT
jgi:hypothetical protein